MAARKMHFCALCIVAFYVIGSAYVMSDTLFAGYSDTNAGVGQWFAGPVSGRNVALQVGAGTLFGFKSVDFSAGFDNVMMGVACDGAAGVAVSPAGYWDFIIDSPTGQAFASIHLLSTGSWDIYLTETAATTTRPTGVHTVYVVGRGNANAVMNWFAFSKNAGTPPTITTQPASQTVLVGQTATFSVVASGAAPLSYQWRKGGANIAGATAASYTTPATVIGDNGSQFTCYVSNGGGNVTSTVATLTVSATPTAPTITTQPANRAVTAGQTATFTVVASGSTPLSYQWSKGGVAIAGATAASYTTPATVIGDNGAQFTCYVSNAVGNVTSTVATLTVTAAPAAPSITTQPVSRAVTVGQTATFTVVASGTAPLSYQWSKGGVAIAGATAASYTTPATVIGDNGAQFTCYVSNSAGNITSNAATLTVNPASIAPTLIPVSSPTYDKRPLLRWHPVNAAQTYTIQIDTISSFADQMISLSTSDTFFVPLANLPVDTIYWHVKSDNSAYSATGSFYIADGRIPALIHHESPTYDVRPTVQWHPAMDTVTTYCIQVASSRTFASPLLTSTTSDTFFTLTTDAVPGMVYWRVKGDSSAYSAPDSFLVLDKRIPRIIPYPEKYTLVRRPVLSWRPVSGAGAYTIEINGSSNFSSALFSLPVSDTFFQPGANLPISTIYWHVRSDLVAAWSDTDHFQIVADSIPFLIRYNGAQVTDKRPVFAWHPVSGAAEYRIQIADNRLFTGSSVIPVSDTLFAPLADLALGAWYWKVSCDKNYALYSPYDSVAIASPMAIRNPLPRGGRPMFNVSISGQGCRVSVFLPGSGGALTLFDVKGNIVAGGNIAMGKPFVRTIAVPRGVYFARLTMPGNKQVFKTIIAR